MNLTPEDDLAVMFGITAEKAADLRKRQSWPHVRLTRFDVRYTDEQIAAIVKARSVAGEQVIAGSASGLTSRSAKKAS